MTVIPFISKRKIWEPASAFLGSMARPIELTIASGDLARFTQTSRRLT